MKTHHDRDPLYTFLIVAELVMLIGMGVCFGFITLTVQRNIDALLKRPQGISKAEFDRAIETMDHDIIRLQYVTRQQTMEEDED